MASEESFYPRRTSSSPSSSSRYGGGPAIFSASKTPPGPGLESSCELPFGCLWTPLGEAAIDEQQRAESSPSSSSSSCWNRYKGNHGAALPPSILCLTCCAYLNMYAELEADKIHQDSTTTIATTGVWICPLCLGRNVAPQSILQSAITQAPGIEYHQQTTVTTTANSSSLDTFSSSLQQQQNEDSLAIILVLDQHLPKEQVQAIGVALQTILTVNNNNYNNNEQIRVGLIVFGKLLRVYQLGTPSRQGLVAADVFSKHEQITDAHLSQRRYLTTRSSASIDTSLESLWRALTAVYGVTPPAEENEANRMTQQQQYEIPPLSRLERLKQQKQERIQKAQEKTTATAATTTTTTRINNSQTSPWMSNHNSSTTKPRRPLRCTGEAIQAAVDLATIDPNKPARTARILLFTNGCPNYGDGSVVLSSDTTTFDSAKETLRKVDIVHPVRLSTAVEYFTLVGTAAAEVGVAVDVLCAGSSELGLPAYQGLVEPSSGYVLTQVAFETEALTRNLQFLLQETFVNGLHFAVPDAPGSSLPLSDENWVGGCILDIRMPSFITTTHMVGPGELVEQNKDLLANERSSFAVGASLATSRSIKIDNLPSDDIVDATLTRLHLGRFDPISTFSIMFQINEFFQNESHALFQFIARFVDRHGNVLVTRVYSRRLSIAKSIGEFLDVVDEDVVPVLLGKEAVYRSIYGRDAKKTETPDSVTLENYAHVAQQDIDATIQRISVAYRLLGLQLGAGHRGVDLTEEGGIRAAGSSTDFAFPPELSESLRRIYHFRRGPLISPDPMRADDDRAHIRSLFIRLPLDECLSMMAVSLWSSGPLDSKALRTHVSTVPADTMSKWDTVILAADHFYELFVWSGCATLDAKFDAVRNHFQSFLLEQSKDRFPAPTLYLLQEGDSMSRRFSSLLAPSHGDPLEHQLAHFPALGTLSPDELTSLQSKFKFHDSSTDASFRNWFWNISSASNISKGSGVSLCD